MKFLKRLALTLALLGIASPASAAIKYATQSGTGDGSSCVNADALSDLNGTLNAGDVCVLCPGTFTTMPNPTNAGSGWEPGTRITFVGNLSDTSAVILDGNLTMADNYVTIKGVRVTGDITVNADGCSLAFVTANGFISWSGSDHGMVTNCIFRGPSTHFNWSTCTEDTIQYCLINAYRTVADDDERWMYVAGLHNSLFQFNDITYNVAAPNNSAHSMLMYGCRNNTFRYNTWDMTNSNGSNNYVFGSREGCFFNTINGDSIWLRDGAGFCEVALSCDGGLVPPYGGHYWTVDSCFVKQEFSGSAPAFRSSANGANNFDTRGLTFTNNVVIGHGNRGAQVEPTYSLFGLRPTDSSKVEHNTFVSLANGDANGQPAFGYIGGLTTTFRYNILYRDQTETCDGSNKYDVVYLVSTGDADVVSDYNLIYIVSPGNPPYGYVGHYNCSSGCNSAGCANLVWDTTKDTHSKARSPQFEDSTLATFDPYPLPGSYALDDYWPDGYVGAHDQKPAGSPVIWSPAGGEEWVAGSSHDITWDVTNPGGSGCTPVRTKLWWRLSDDDEWTIIADDLSWETKLNGTYSWSIPQLPTTTARVLVQLYRTNSAVCASDSSAGTFEILDNVAPDVGLNITLSNDEWRLCETNTIGWTASDDVGIDHFVITLEEFGNGYWFVLDDDVNGNARSYNWVMPATASLWSPELDDYFTFEPGMIVRIAVWAYDGTGNVDSARRVAQCVVYDKKAPIVIVMAPLAGTYPIDTTLTVSWTAVDCVSGGNLTTALYVNNYTNDDFKIWVKDVDNGSPTTNVDLTGYPFNSTCPIQAGDQIRFWISAIDDYSNQGWDDGSLMTLKAVEDVGTVPNKVRDLWAYEVASDSLKLKWTSVGDVASTELKYDTTPLTQSGAGDFRTHGTVVTNVGSPAAAGALDSVWVRGLTPNTRYYFALRHIGNTGTPVETSLVSIPIARTTFKGGLRGSAPRSTRNYPLLGMEMIPYFDSVVDADSFPRNSPGWPVYQGTVSSFSLRDSARKALYGADMIYHMGVNGAARDYDPSYWSRNEYWGVPDSIFKSINPNGVVGVAGGSTSMPCMKRQVAPKDSNKWVVNNRSDLPWDYDDVINWWVGKYGLSGKHVFNAVGGGTYTLPESLFLWSDTQNDTFTTGYSDTCVWGAWYGDKASPCYGVVTSSPGQMNLNILHVDTLTGELDVVERIAQRRMELTFNNSKYVSSNKWQADVFSGDFAAGWPDERLVGIAADAAIDSLDYARTTGARSYIDAYQRFRDASNEFFARAYYWKNIYRTDGLGTMTVNYFGADVPDRMAWDVTDSGEMLTYATKGGLSGGPQKFLNPPTTFFYPNSNYPGSQFEPPFGQMEFSRLNSSPASQFAIRWNIYHIDTLGGRYPVTYGTRLPRLRTALGIACMFNNIFVHPTRQSDNNSEYMNAAANDFNFPYLDAKMDWFWLDEAFVNTNTRMAQRWNAWGTGLGKNWLGKPLDDKWQYGLKVTSSADTLLMDSLRVVTSGDPSGLKYYAASSSFNDTSGWSISAAGQWGSITKVTNAPGANGNSCLKISRAKVSHSAPYNLGMYTRGWFPVGKDKRTSIRFRAKADSVTYIQVGLRDAGTQGSSWLENGRCVYLDTTWRTYAHEVGFVSDSVDRHPAQILFQFADTLGTVYLDSVVFYASGVGVIYRRFENGVVFVNPDDTEDKIINIQTLLGDTASYDYANIWSPDDSPTNGNNGRVFGYSGAATDTVFAGTPKFIIRRANGTWNTGANISKGKKKKWWEWWVNPSGEPTPIK